MVREFKEYCLLDSLIALERHDSDSHGRECYAFSRFEDEAVRRVMLELSAIFNVYGVSKEKCEMKMDALGNLFVTYYGKDKSKSVVCGSHIDSVARGGKFDGLAGICSAVAFLEKILKDGRQPEKNYMIAVFRAEESSPKTGVACLGSMVATGLISKEELESIQYRDDKGNSVLLRDHFVGKYGVKQWEAVLHELDNPPLTKENVVNYEELHIEQSAVCERNNVDVGIVVDGIGGSVREKVFEEIDAGLNEEVGPTEKKPYFKYKIIVEGEAAHTGGTPPNPKLKKKFNSGSWYRNDALVSAAYLGRLLMRLNGTVKLLSMGVEKETGFTTVPDLQVLEFLVPENTEEEFEKILAACSNRVTLNFGTEVRFEKCRLSEGKVNVYGNGGAMKYLGIPLKVERAVREEVSRQSGGNGGIGRVRATVTDFKLEKGSVKYNLDFRDVDTKAVIKLIDDVHEKIEAVSTPQIERIATKYFEPVDHSAVEIKEKLAQRMRLSYVMMPSLPGHDASCFAAIGVPVSMTFIRHDGISHNAREHVDYEYMEKAIKISHGYLMKLLF
jgi:hypothetical protein